MVAAVAVEAVEEVKRAACPTTLSRHREKRPPTWGRAMEETTKVAAADAVDAWPFSRAAAAAEAGAGVADAVRRGRGSAAAARVRARPPRTWNAAKIEGLAACIKVTEANRARTKGDRRREPPGGTSFPQRTPASDATIVLHTSPYASVAAARAASSRRAS